MVNRKEMTTMIDDDLPIEELGDEDVVPAEEVEQTEAEQNTIKSLQDLIAIGKQRGYVTEGDILQLVPNPETDIDKLEQIQSALSQASIATRDALYDSDVEVQFDDDTDLEDGLNAEGISVSDTVRMYLREIGR